MPKTKSVIKSLQRRISDFWINEADVSELDSKELVGGFDLSKNSTFSGDFDRRVIQLASARRAIGNFVSILTDRDIPVMFNELGFAPGATDGKRVILSTSIVNRDDFDWGVGLAYMKPVILY